MAPQLAPHRGRKLAIVLSKLGRIILYGLGGLVAVCLLAGGASALINLGLPTHSEVVDRLASAEKDRLAEFSHLRQTLGSAVWPGWGEVDIPVILYNEEYAFLVGYPDPPSGWLKMPQRQTRGGPWEAVPEDAFDGQTYYRQRLAGPQQTPEGFTVLVGDRWVATFQTKEYSLVAFVSGFRERLPPVVREVFPFKMAWRRVLGESEAYITLLLHEAFHAYQGMANPDRFAQAEGIMRLESRYPWDDPAQQAAWQTELDLLVDAAKTTRTVEAVELARRFLDQRDARRTQSGLSSELADFERQREWLEGSAKYAEMASGRLAAATPGYEALPALTDDREFTHYSTRERHWSQQLDEVRRMLGHEGEVRFYYSGFAQAVLLDALMPRWKDRALPGGVWL